MNRLFTWILIGCCTGLPHFNLYGGNSHLLSARADFSASDSLNAELLTGAKVLAEARKEIVPGKTIRQEQLEQSGSIAEAARHFSGLQLKDFGGIGGMKTLNIRSLGSEHTGIYIDGIAVENAQNMQVDLGRFSADSYQKMEVFNGQRSLRLQSAKEYANSNALYLSTSAPLFSGKERDHLRLKLRGGAFSTGMLSGKWEHRFQKGLRSRVGWEATSTSGRYHFNIRNRITYPDGTVFQKDTTLTRLNGDMVSGRLEAWLFGDNWKVQTYVYASNRGLPGPVIRRTAENPTTMDRQTDVNFFVQGEYHLRPLEMGAIPSSISLKGKVTQDYLHYWTQPALDPSAQPIDNTYRQTSVYLSYAQLFALSDRWSLNVSADGQYNYLDGNMYAFVFPHRLSGWAAVATSYYAGRWKFSGSLLYHIAKDKIRQVEGGFDHATPIRQAFSPYAIVSYSVLPDRWEFHAFAKQASRMPTFNDLYYTTVGNSNLRPEYTRQVDFGTNFRLPCHLLTFMASADFYRNWVKDQIIAVPSANQFRWSMFNIGKVHITGIDLDMKLDYNDAPTGLNVFADLQYTWQNALDFTHPEEVTYRNQIPYIPHHSGSLSGHCNWRGWGLSATWSASSRKWSTSSNIPAYEIAAWQTADLDISKSIRLGDPHASHPSVLDCRISFRNLSNEQYQFVQGFPIPGFHVMCSIGYRF